MTDKTHRDAITGQYVTADHAKTNPDTTVSESPCAECERLRCVVHTQGVALDHYLVEVERLRADMPIVRTVGDLTARHIGQSVRELQRRLDAVVALCIDGPHADDCDRDEGGLDPRCPACWTLNIRRAAGVES